MRTKLLNTRNMLLFLAGLLAIILIYSIDLYKLTYRLQGWKTFGQAPLAGSQIQYFVPDIPALIGFREPESGEAVTCGTTVAYVKTGEGTYRCCDTGDRIACLAGNFSGEIPVADEQCTQAMKSTFGVPDTLVNTADYKVFASCANGSLAVTVTQIDSSGQILWKTVNTRTPDLIATVLRCIVAPLLLGFLIWLVVSSVRGKKNEPIPRF